MEKDNKVLISAILIILVALVSFNFGDITGKAVKENTVVAISPLEVTAGETITVYVKPGSNGVEKLAYVYSKKGIRLPGTISLCRSSKCEDVLSVEYKIIDTWDNNEGWDFREKSKGYYVKVIDSRTEDYSTASFTVKRKYEAAGPAVHL